MKQFIFIIGMLFGWTFNAEAQQNVSRISDVIYDYKAGVAFVFDVITPEEQNGAAILRLVSGGWESWPASVLSTRSFRRYTERGYTVFVVSHGSQPRYTIPEIIGQVQRAIRYIRFHADEFGIDPGKLGITGQSSGGHLSVSAGVFGQDEMSEQEYRKNRSVSAGKQIDPVELVSAKVQAVACFSPPTNFVHYLDKHTNWFDFFKARNLGVSDAFIATADSSKAFQNEILRSFSPYFFVSEKTPPMCIVHGTADELVPFSQSVSFVAKLMEYEVSHLFVPREAKGHTWRIDSIDHNAFTMFFDKYLLRASTVNF